MQTSMGLNAPLPHAAPQHSVLDLAAGLTYVALAAPQHKSPATTTEQSPRSHRGPGSLPKARQRRGKERARQDRGIAEHVVRPWMVAL